MNTARCLLRPFIVVLEKLEQKLRNSFFDKLTIKRGGKDCTAAGGDCILRRKPFICDYVRQCSDFETQMTIYGLPLFARKAGCSETKVRLHAYIRPISEQYALALMTFARGCLISSTV